MCDPVCMAPQRKGRTKVIPGAWSLAVAEAMAAVIDTREGRRDRFAEEAGFSSRLSQLLNGERSWYLEDVERACTVLGWDVAAFLDEVNPTSKRPSAPSEVHLKMAAKDPGYLPEVESEPDT